MIINGDGGYGLLAAYIGGPAALADWLGPKVGGHLAPFLYSSREPSELSKWLCHDDSTINIVVVIIILYYYSSCSSSYCWGDLFQKSLKLHHFKSDPDEHWKDSS